jgi:uncharacterized protein YbaR (Trm112 family)
MNEWLLSVLCDPVDREPLFYVPAAKVLVNPRTSQVYDIRDDIPVLIPGDARTLPDNEIATLMSSDGSWTGER